MGANLRGADLRDANLSEANLRGANLSEANLMVADLSDANLSDANLREADLRGANLRGANLRVANLRVANLRVANLRVANLHKADLRAAILDNVYFDYSTIGYNISCPEEGDFIAWKKAGGLVVKLKIPSDAKRSSATTAKCRASHAIVLEIYNMDGTVSDKEPESRKGCVYKKGEIVRCDEWGEDRWNECSGGIHFFVNKQNAIDY